MAVHDAIEARRPVQIRSGVPARAPSRVEDMTARHPAQRVAPAAHLGPLDAGRGGWAGFGPAAKTSSPVRPPGPFRVP
jgi:hypothetical protein